MNLKILLPFDIFTEKTGVSRIVAETHHGSFGILPRRLDCVAALTAGILTYETPSEGEVFLAVDEGVLVKAGAADKAPNPGYPGVIAYLKAIASILFP